MYEVGSQAIEVFASGVCIPIEASYGVAVMSYAPVKGCPVSARMRDAGGPFLLKGLRVIGFYQHPSFIDYKFICAKFIYDFCLKP
jgi:hypothetical protein